MSDADVHRNELLQEWHAHQGQVLQVQYSEDDNSIFSVGEDKTVSYGAEVYYSNFCIACHALCVRFMLTQYIVQLVPQSFALSYTHLWFSVLFTDLLCH